MSERPIDNLRSLLDGGVGAWVPFSLDVGAIPGFTAPVERTFRRMTGAEDPAEHFAADVRLFSLRASFGGDDPAAIHQSVEPGTTFDEWGIGHRAADVEGAVDKTYAPLARASSVEDVEALPSPAIETDVDTSAIEAHHAAGYPVFGYAGSIYEWSWWIRGMADFLVDLMSNPPMAEALIRKAADHTTRLALASARAGVDVLCMYDDAGMQHGMQISPELWRQFIKPAWRRVIETVRGEVADAKFFLHSCGKIDPIVPDVIEVGFDVLHPVQPECMSFEDAYRRYGKDILLAATISSQRLFPFGSADDVRREVERYSKILAGDRRAILMPSNLIQPETPWENVVAFAESARALREGVL
ncbi:MAG: uroporphyrinogen decarboxylase family protein [Planctomycetota bacterium]